MARRIAEQLDDLWSELEMNGSCPLFEADDSGREYAQLLMMDKRWGEVWLSPRAPDNNSIPALQRNGVWLALALSPRASADAVKGLLTDPEFALALERIVLFSRIEWEGITPKGLTPDDLIEAAVAIVARHENAHEPCSVWSADLAVYEATYTYEDLCSVWPPNQPIEVAEHKMRSIAESERAAIYGDLEEALAKRVLAFYDDEDAPPLTGKHAEWARTEAERRDLGEV